MVFPHFLVIRMNESNLMKTRIWFPNPPHTTVEKKEIETNKLLALSKNESELGALLLY